MISAYPAPCWHGRRGIRIWASGSDTFCPRAGRVGRAKLSVGKPLHDDHRRLCGAAFAAAGRNYPSSSRTAHAVSNLRFAARVRNAAHGSPRLVAHLSMCSRMSSGSVAFTRMHLGASVFTATRIATPPLLSGNSITPSRVDGSGRASPSSTNPST
jgi:hypothetical protein